MNPVVIGRVPEPIAVDLGVCKAACAAKEGA